MFGCICPNNHMKRRCDKIFTIVNHNPCVGKEILSHRLSWKESESNNLFSSRFENAFWHEMFLLIQICFFLYVFSWSSSVTYEKVRAFVFLPFSLPTTSFLKQTRRNFQLRDNITWQLFSPFLSTILISHWISSPVLLSV